MITVIGRATSVNVQAVVWTLAELGLDFDRIDAGGSFGGLDTPEYGRMNPNRLVPVLKDRGLTLWESAAIVRYLGAQYADGPFWPAEPGKRAMIDKWAEWAKTTFGPTLLTGIFWPLIGTPPAKRDMAGVQAAAQRLQKLTVMIDQRLAEGDYLGGADLSFADVMFGVLLYRYFTLDFDRAEAPRLEAYYGRLTARPAYAEHVMVSYDSLRAK